LEEILVVIFSCICLAGTIVGSIDDNESQLNIPAMKKGAIGAAVLNVSTLSLIVVTLG